MSLLKQCISSPLEAGTSLLDTQHLPSHLTQALEYASKRLARKAVPVTLIVVRRDYQVPSCATPTSSTASTPSTPEFWTTTNSSHSLFAVPVTGIRQLVRRGTNASIASLSSVSTVSSSTASDSGYGSTCSTSTSPTFPPPAEPIATPRRWPLISGGFGPSMPSSVSTATLAASNVSAGGPSPVGVRLLQVHPLTPKEEKTLRTTFTKAERRFGTNRGLFPPVTTASSCGLNGDLIRRSILQNEVLFSSEGLTLLGLDRLYTFKAALSAYARTTLPPSSLASPLVPGESRARIEDAVDELRRLVLANGGRSISKADLHRSYDWIGVSASALGDVERMYRRAYGGWERAGAFEMAPDETEREMKNAPVEPEEKKRNILRIGTPPAKAPVLKLQTTFDKSLKRPRAIRPEIVQPRSAEIEGEGGAKEIVELEIKIDRLGIADDGDEDEDLTARPPASAHPCWNSLGSSIDAMLKRKESPIVADGMSRLSVDSQRQGPLTPNGFDDISPITRGEWGFLFSEDGSMSRARTAPVETF